MGTVIDLTGQTFGELVVIAFADLGAGRQARWTCRCTCGATAVVIGRHLRSGNTRSCGHLQGNGGGRPRQAFVSYKGAHERLRINRGPARNFSCLDCAEQADEWSYQGGDADELISDRGLPYSLNPDLYVPRCRPCHRRHDSRLPTVA